MPVVVPRPVSLVAASTVSSSDLIEVEELEANVVEDPVEAAEVTARAVVSPVCVGLSGRLGRDDEHGVGREQLEPVVSPAFTRSNRHGRP